MKFAWRKTINDYAFWNSEQVEEVDNSLMEYEDFLTTDWEQAEWDGAKDEILSWS